MHKIGTPDCRKPAFTFLTVVILDAAHVDPVGLALPGSSSIDQARALQLPQQVGRFAVGALHGGLDLAVGIEAAGEAVLICDAVFL